MVSFSGPTRPSTDVKKFKETGKSVKKAPVFSGPTRPSTDVKTFRKTGSSVSSSSSRARARAREKTLANAKAKAEELKKANALAQEQQRLRDEKLSSQLSKKQSEELMRKQLIKDILTKDKSGKLRPVTGLTSTIAQEQQRLRDEKLIQASIPRTFTTEKQIESFIFTKQKAKKKVRDVLLKELTKDLLKQTDQQKLLNKFTTGQSLTPTQLKQIQVEIIKTSKQLTKKQITLLKNAPIEISSGLFEVGKETIFLPVNLIKGSFNYGKSLRKRFDDGENIPFIKDIGKLGKGIIKVTDLVIRNPKKAAVIVGLASTKVKGNLIDNFIKNPIKTTTKAVAILFSGKIIGGVGKGIKKLSETKRVQSVLHAQKFTSNKFRVVSDLTTGVSKIRGNTKGNFLNGKKFTTEYSLRLNPKTKQITGNLKTKIGKKTTVERISLEDKAGFYLDTKTGMRIPKITTGIKSRSITIKETSTKIIKGSERQFSQGGSFANTVDADFTSIITRIIDNTKKVSVRTGKLTLAKITEKGKTKLKTFAVQLTKDIKKAKKTKIAKPLTKTQIKGLEEFIDLVGIENLGGLDRRIKIAKILGIRKTSGLIKPLEEVIDKLGKLKKIKITKAKAVFRGEIIKKSKPKIKLNLQTRKLSDLRKSKKGQISLLKNDEIVLLKKKGLKLETPRVIRIPQLKSKVPLTIPKLKQFRLLGKVTSLLSKLSVLDKIQKNELKQQLTQKQTNKLINDVIKDIKQINKVIQEQTQDVKQIITPILITKPIVTSRTKPIPRITPPSPPPSPPPKTLRIVKKKLKFNTKLKRGERLSFNFEFRERVNPSKKFNKKSNPVKKKTIIKRTPENTTLKSAINKIRSSLARSLDIKIVGVTKLKDINKPSLKGFRLKKVGTDTLRLVQINPLETKIERKLITQARKRSVKTVSKKKVIKKNKKK